MPNTKRQSLTVVSAPNIPVTEIQPFTHRYTRRKRVVENFEFTVQTVTYGRGDKVLVIAPGLPLKEVKALRTHLREALNNPAYTLVVNYECQLDVVPQVQSRHKDAV